MLQVYTVARLPVFKRCSDLAASGPRWDGIQETQEFQACLAESYTRAIEEVSECEDVIGSQAQVSRALIVPRARASAWWIRVLLDDSFAIEIPRRESDGAPLKQRFRRVVPPRADNDVRNEAGGGEGGLFIEATETSKGGETR